jgi:hypothetical protein
MKNKKSMLYAAVLALAGALLSASPQLWAQAVHYLGTVTAINGDTLAVKTDAGDLHQVQVPSSAALKRVAPGQTDLSKAEAITFDSLAIGDRVLVTLDPDSTGSTPQAARVIAIKQADVAKKQQAETEAWSQGVHGLVKNVDPASGVIVVNLRTGAATKAVTVNTTAATVLKRYASGSVRFDQAQPAPIAAIHAGDQLWARGLKSADGASIAADGIVSGSFRSIAGTVLFVDPAASTVTVKDLATKKPVSVHLTADAQLRRLDDNAATMLAARLKGGQSAFQGFAGGHPGGSGVPTGAMPTGAMPAGVMPPRGAGQGRPGASGNDMESILDHAPVLQIAALKKGDAVMVVATEDASGINVIKLLAGVEPLLQGPEAQNLLSSWSLSQGSADAQ